MSFLPDDYQAPRTTNYYMKLLEGENRIRIMSKPVFGWEDWLDNKPVRYAMDKKPSRPNDPKKPIKHFWAFVVFNYQEEQIQIMQVTQSTIRKSLESLCNDKDWGAPYGYDIKIMKTGEGMDTEYSVNPVPHKPIDDYLMSCFKERPCDLNALFDNADPFSSDIQNITPLALIEEVSKEKQTKVVSIHEKKAVIGTKKGEELCEILTKCSPAYVENLHKFMKKEGIEKYEDIPLTVYEKVYVKACAERELYHVKLKEEEKSNKEEGVDELF